MSLFKSNLLIILLIFSSIVTIKCQSNDTEITTESAIENEGSGSDESEEHENVNSISDPKDQPPSSSSSSAKPDGELRTRPTLPSVIDDNISDDDLNTNNREETNEFTNNNGNSAGNEDDDLFSDAPSSSSSTASDKSDKSSSVANDLSSSSPAPKSSDESKNKLSYEDCVALGNENCGTPPDDSDNFEDEGFKSLKDNEPSKPTVTAEDKQQSKPTETKDNKDNKVDNTNRDNNQINSDENKSIEPQEQKPKHGLWYDELPLKLGLPFILLLFVLFVIIFLLFLIFLIQDSFSRTPENDQNNETIKIKSGYGTQKFNFNQLQMLEKRMKAAREDVDLDEVNVQSLNDNKKDDRNDDQNNNVPSEFENIALQDKSSSSIRM